MLLLYLSLTGILLSIILLYFDTRKYTSNIYLGIFFFLLSLSGISHYTMLYSESVILITWFYNFPIPLFYLIGPMLYWYVRSVLEDRNKLTKRDILHFIPALLFLISAIPYFFTSYSFKVGIAKSIVENRGFLLTYKSNYLAEIFSVTALLLSRPLLFLIYTLGSIYITIRYMRRRTELGVLSGQNFMIKWLTLLMGFSLILSVGNLISLFDSIVFKYYDLFFTINILQVFSAIGLVGLLISPFFFPNILYGLPRFDDLVSKQELDVVPKTREQNFESDYLQLIEKKIKIGMREEQPYRQPDLNLNKFAELLEIPSHHLAYYFREIKGQSFNDYRNECRLTHAKQLIIDGKAETLTLEAIARLSGFTTRNTFFTSFKKAEGISPSAFVSKVTQSLN